MNFNNLLSGFLGAVIAVILAEVWRQILLAINRRKKRKIFVEYIKNVIRPGIANYINDANKVKSLIQTYPNENTIYGQHVFDMLPSLNSEIFKELGFNELYYITSDFKLHEITIDIYHCIDYLKSLMPLLAHQNFIDLCDAHFKEKGCITIDDLIAHASNCETIDDTKTHAIGNLNLHLSSATTSLENCDLLIKKLS
ncbi:MAG: hypothetical protein EOO43_03485 [Flavobacterium sp.]|nr:MAG: hypothetical protein EOO43_03485 [Flavobacterium sp.]